MAVPTASAVSVLVIDCTSTGASPPTHTLRSPLAMSTLRLKRRAWGPEGIAMLEEDICCWSRFIVAGEGKRGRAYFKLSRATAPLVAGKGSAAPRRVAVTPSGLPTTRVTGSVISTDSVLPAFSKRDNTGAPLARRTSTQESALTVSTRVLAPGAAAAGAAAAAVGSAAGAAGAAWPAAGEPGVTALGGGTEIRGTEGFCKFGAGAAAWGTVVCGTVVNGAATVPVVVDAGGRRFALRRQFRHPSKMPGGSAGARQHHDGEDGNDGKGSPLAVAGKAHFGKRGGLAVAQAGVGGVAGTGGVQGNLGHQRGGIEPHDLGVGAHETAHDGGTGQAGTVARFQRHHLAHGQFQLIGHLLDGPAHRFALGGKHLAGRFIAAFAFRAGRRLFGPL